MTESLGSAVLELSADDKISGQIDAAGSNARKQIGNAGKTMMKAGAGLSLGLTAPIIGFGKVAYDELTAIQKADAQTGAMMKRLGKETLLSADLIKQRSGALQEMSGFDDQAIQSGSNLIGTLSAINTTTSEGRDMFLRAQSAMVDMAAAMGTEPEAAAKLVSKSMAAAAAGTLQLPKGMKLAANEQRKLKKEFAAAHGPTERQALIMDVLSKKFEGAGKAAGGTTAAKLAVLKDRFAGAGAALLTQLLPYLDDLVGWLKKGMTWFESLGGSTKKYIAIGLALAAVIGPLLIVLGMLVTAVAAIGLPVIAVVAVIGALVAALVIAYRRSDRFREIVQKVVAFLKQHKMAVLAMIAPMAVLAIKLYQLYQRSATFRAIIATVISMIRSWIATTASIIGKIVMFVAHVAKAIAKSQTFKAVVALVKTAVHLAAQKIARMASDAVELGQKVAGAAAKIKDKFQPQIDWIKKNAAAAFGPIKKALSEIDKFIGGMIDKLNTFLKALGKAPKSGGKSKSSRGRLADFVVGGSPALAVAGDVVASDPGTRDSRTRSAAATRTGATQHVTQVFRGEPDTFAATRLALMALRSSGLVGAGAR